jgi:hypothetical protein
MRGSCCSAIGCSGVSWLVEELFHVKLTYSLASLVQGGLSCLAVGDFGELWLVGWGLMFGGLTMGVC